MPDATLTTPAEVLKAARRVIERPENWTKKALARDVLGNATVTLSPNACCFCARGAVRRVRPRCTAAAGQQAEILLSYAVPTEYQRIVADFNDNPETTHADILALYDRAIALAERSEGNTQSLLTPTPAAETGEVTK